VGSFTYIIIRNPSTYNRAIKIGGAGGVGKADAGEDERKDENGGPEQEEENKEGGGGEGMEVRY
jgi:hypothetical protein